MTAPTMLQRYCRDREAVLGRGMARNLARRLVLAVGAERALQLVSEEADAVGEVA